MGGRSTKISTHHLVCAGSESVLVPDIQTDTIHASLLLAQESELLAGKCYTWTMPEVAYRKQEKWREKSQQTDKIELECFTQLE